MQGSILDPTTHRSDSVGSATGAGAGAARVRDGVARRAGARGEGVSRDAGAGSRPPLARPADRRAARCRHARGEGTRRFRPRPLQGVRARRDDDALRRVPQPSEERVAEADRAGGTGTESARGSLRRRQGLDDERDVSRVSRLRGVRQGRRPGGLRQLRIAGRLRAAARHGHFGRGQGHARALRRRVPRPEGQGVAGSRRGRCPHLLRPGRRRLHARRRVSRRADAPALGDSARLGAVPVDSTGRSVNARRRAVDCRREADHARADGQRAEDSVAADQLSRGGEDPAASRRPARA